MSGYSLITGASGFLGRHLTERLVSDGERVVATGRSSDRLAYVNAQHGQMVVGDLCNQAFTKQLCEGADTVFHCAALSSPWGPYKAFHRANIEATENLVEASLVYGVKNFIHVSTPSVYFDFTDRLLISETEPLPGRFANHYAATKYAAEEVVLAAAAKGLNAVIIRPRGLFGEYDRTIFPRILEVAKNGSFPLPGGGRALVDVTYVGNVVDALVLCRNRAESVSGEVFNISNGSPIAVRDMLTRLFEAIEIQPTLRDIPLTVAKCVGWVSETIGKIRPGQPEPSLTRYGVGVLGHSQTLDISKARDLLGYEPRVSIDEGIALFANWWRQQSCE